METLRNLAEISITIAGFSALITLFQNKGTEWKFIDKNNLNRFYIMIESSLLSCVYCYIPVILIGFIDTTMTFRVASLIFVMVSLFYSAFVLIRNKKMTGSENPGGVGTVLMKYLSFALIILAILNFFGILGNNYESIYKVIVFIVVIGTFYFFLRIIYSSIKIPDNHNS